MSWLLDYLLSCPTPQEMVTEAEDAAAAMDARHAQPATPEQITDEECMALTGQTWAELHASVATDHRWF